jgi:hypothetical protein
VVPPAGEFGGRKIRVVGDGHGQRADVVEIEDTPSCQFELQSGSAGEPVVTSEGGAGRRQA